MAPISPETLNAARSIAVAMANTARRNDIDVGILAAADNEVGEAVERASRLAKVQHDVYGHLTYVIESLATDAFGDLADRLDAAASACDDLLAAAHNLRDAAVRARDALTLSASLQGEIERLTFVCGDRQRATEAVHAAAELKDRTAYDAILAGTR
jgi:hypothetical protein